ncbi:hypothetical protein [Bacillus altitudinis]|uniref:hypothetical protein n=1 Tax=Bacillus altitudinis TaxID=293387 RepID=UPI002DB88FD1|nr:hypothetical protein [Bacillus altitudinis]MEC3812798.1 hypothetical protein [Bacillus altitudinis]
MGFTEEERDKIKELLDYLRHDEVGALSNPNFRKIVRKKDSNFETFCYDSSDSAYNAIIGWEGQSYYYGYKESFFNIAHQSIEHSHLNSDIIVYSVIFNYRHYLELVLKDLITKFQIFFRVPLSATITHNLIELLNTLLEILKNVNLDFLISSTIIKVIEDFHNLDSKNDAFRFVYNRQGGLNHTFDHKKIDLLKLHYTMNEVYDDFNSIDCLFEPDSFFYDEYLMPYYESFIIALQQHISNSKMKQLDSVNKIKERILDFQHKLRRNGQTFSFKEEDISQHINPYEFIIKSNELKISFLLHIENNCKFIKIF